MLDRWRKEGAGERVDGRDEGGGGGRGWEKDKGDGEDGWLEDREGRRREEGKLGGCSTR